MSDPVRTRRALELFKQAFPRDASERARLLDSACADDAELRALVEDMLRGGDEDEGRSGDWVADAFAAAQQQLTGSGSADVSPGDAIGRYRILRRIGEGGFGTVYVAEQREPVVRQVALKLIKLGMDSPQVVARFERERQALALMEHPNIARVLDAGTTDAGRPYFVMDLVDGVPITEYCDAQRLSIGERLELFVQVCLAVQHAHTKGIIHRDLKPSNVLVSTVDERPLAKVIDFGIAKATERERNAKTLFTEARQLVGTPEYMSPEQAAGSADIDTRTDVYSLGVLLYELVTGSTPFRSDQLREAALDEIQRIIRDVDPPRPSALLRDSTETLDRVAASRSVAPRRLSSLMRGELDWIVMKPLEKDRERRYQTARGMALDIRRYLAGEAVEARPPSRAYRVQKFLRRNRGVVVAASLVLVVLVAGIIGTTSGLLQARENERVANERLARLEKGVDILGSIFVDLDPMAERNGEPLSAALARQLDRAVDELGRDTLGDPLVTAGIRETLGASLMGLGRYDEAVRVLESVVDVRRAELGADDVSTLEAQVRLATATTAGGAPDRGCELFEAILPGIAAVVPEDDELALRCRGEYAGALAALRRFDEAFTEFDAVLRAFREAGKAEEPFALNASARLASAHLEHQNFEEAIAILEDLVPRIEAVVGVDHPDALGARNDLAMAYQQAGEYVRCVPLLQEVHEALIVRLGADHPRTLESHFNVAFAQRKAGQIHNAVPIFERLLSIYEARLGPSNVQTLTTMSELAASFIDLGEYARARELLERAIDAAPPLANADLFALGLRTDLAHVVNRTGDRAAAIELYEDVAEAADGTSLADTSMLIKARFQWSELLAEEDDTDRAIEIARATLDDAESHLGTEHPVTCYGRNALSYAYRYAGRIEDALPLLEKNLELIALELGDEHPQTIITRVNFASAVRDAGADDRALDLMELGIEQSNRTNGERHETTLLIREIHADTLAGAEDWERAIAARRAIVSIRRDGAEPSTLARSLYSLGRTLESAARPADAEVALREALAIRESVEADSLTTFINRSAIGGVLLDQGRLDEAEPFLLAGYAGMRQRADELPRASWHRMLGAIERLVQLYEALEQPADVARWTAELERAREEKDADD